MIVKALPDIVDIVIPPQNYLKFIKIAAKNIVNVICQKPFTNSLAEAKNAVKTAKKHGIKIAVHENFRYQPWYRKIDDLLNSFLGGFTDLRYRNSLKILDRWDDET